MSVIGVLKRKKENLTENKTKTELCIECEKIIADEKKEYGRVSIMTMRFLREKYGDDRANRAMWRQQKKTIQKDEPSMIDELSSILSSLVKDKQHAL